jgi:demethylmenaquinone methyltransferase / 2-methoxy-6-polyprenyl-1,4-benzoquinol methylase
MLVPLRKEFSTAAFSMQSFLLTFAYCMSTYNHDDIVPFKNSSLSKKEQVASMFNDIAFRYDFLNRFLSGGIDRYWRKQAIAQLKLLNPALILDVATGTADVAIMMNKYLKAQKITGIDISEGMLEIGRKKIARQNLDAKIVLLQGDSEDIQFADNSFDAVTVAFGVRNFENLQKGLKEIKRVLRPGGKLVVLEFSQPKSAGFKGIYTFYLKLIAPRIGKMLSRNDDAYRYLNDSVSAFPEGQRFVDILLEAGYSNTNMKRLSLGICSIYSGDK